MKNPASNEITPSCLPENRPNDLRGGAGGGQESSKSWEEPLSRTDVNPTRACRKAASGYAECGHARARLPGAAVCAGSKIHRPCRPL